MKATSHIQSNAAAWIVSGPHILTNRKGEYDGEGWQVNRPHPREGKHSAREWVMDGRLVKFFRTEKSAIARCKNLNRE